MYYEYFLFQQQVASNLPPVIGPTQRLPSLAQTAQKSAAWHAESRNMLSGHEFGPVCVGTPSEYELVVAKKCVPEVIIDASAPLTESPTVFITPEDGQLGQRPGPRSYRNDGLPALPLRLWKSARFATTPSVTR